MSVRAKFKVESVTNKVGGSSIVLNPVISDSEENAKFYVYTPAGKIELTTVNLDAASYFIPGHDYYIDMTKVHE